MMFKSLSFIFVYSLLLASFINPATAAFDPASELKVFAADGAAGDWFGASVSIDGTRMAVGSYFADVGGNNDQGAVYIYDFDGTHWNETVKLIAAGGAANDYFGHSISLSGNRLAVGASGDDNGQGSAYIFDLSGGSWSQTAKLTAADGVATDYFGHSVFLSDNRLVVGAISADIGSNTGQGAAYVFDLSGGSWSETAKLVAADGAANDSFGASVSLFGSRLAVGAYRADIGANRNQGSAYVFDLSGGSWSQTAKLTASDGADSAFFGYSVSLSDNRLAVGANLANIAGNSEQGAAYVFDLSGSAWSETAKLVASDGAAGDLFGISVALSGEGLVVGAFRADIGSNTGQGAAYVFDLSGSAWSETTKLVASDGTAADWFGVSVSLSDNRLAVGGYRANVGSNDQQGVVYVYTAASRAAAVPVPTTNAYGILLMLLAMLGVAWFGVRRS